MVLIFAHGKLMFFARINFRASWKSLFFECIKFRASSDFLAEPEENIIAVVVVTWAAL